MAAENETEKKTNATSSEGDANASAGDEIIDLEGLVRDIDLTPTDGIGKPAGPKPGPAVATAAAGTAAKPAGDDANVDDSFTPPPTKTVAPHEPTHAEELSSDALDAILTEEDPEMAAQMESIRGADLGKGGEDIKAVEQEVAAFADPLHNRVPTTLGERSRFRLLKIGSRIRATRKLLWRSVTDSKTVLRELGHKLKAWFGEFIHHRKDDLKHGFAWMKSRSVAQKLSLLLAMVIMSGFAVIAAKTLRGSLLPKTEKLWIASFKDHADASYTYDLAGAFEDFNDPLLHPEFVISIERVVVNLTRTPDAPESANPMAAFELYLQTDNQEAAVELKDRNVEIRDAIGRSVERMTYPDLSGEDGKAKLKLLLRKDLNELLTKGKVRRVFFKTIVLNPGQAQSDN